MEAYSSRRQVATVFGCSIQEVGLSLLLSGGLVSHINAPMSKELHNLQGARSTSILTNIKKLVSYVGCGNTETSNF